MKPARPSKDAVATRPDNYLVYLPRSESAARRTFLFENPREGFFAFLDRAEGGSADAQAVAGLMYLLGWVNGTPDLDAAEYWAEKSAKEANPYGLWVQAWIHLERERYADGVDCLLDSASLGFSPAVYALGIFALNGVLVQKDTDFAVSLLNKAARMGHFSAKRILATFKRSGAMGLLRLLYSIFVLTPLLALNNLTYSFRPGVFGEDRLIYVRSIVIENAIRRKSGELVDPIYERTLAELFPSAQREKGK